MLQFQQSESQNYLLNRQTRQFQLYPTQILQQRFLDVTINQATIKIGNKKKLFSSNQQINSKAFLKENLLNKIKNYSKRLDQSSKLSKIPPISNQESQDINQANIAANPSKSLSKSTQKQRYKQNSKSNCKIKERFSLEQLQKSKKVKQKQELIYKADIEKVYNYYASKNERKNKILSKAKQFSKNDFNRFLRGSSIIQKNKHIHRFHPEQLGQIAQIVSNNLKQNQCTQISPLICSFEPVKYQAEKSPKNKKLYLPNIAQKKQRQRRRNMNSQQSIEQKQLFLARENSILELKQKKKTKHIVRSLTEINQKIKKTRTQYKNNLLSLKLACNQKSVEQNFIEKWRYKSLFQTQRQKQFQEIYQENSKQKFEKLQNNLQNQKLSFNISQQQQLQLRKLRQSKKQKQRNISLENNKKNRHSNAKQSQQIIKIKKFNFKQCSKTQG